jgi:deoxyribodipyrimidine photolyase
MKTAFQLIEEHGLTLHGDIEHFAALVIANHPPQSYMTWQEGFEAGKQAERARLQAFMRQMIDSYSLQRDPPKEST